MQTSSNTNSNKTRLRFDKRVDNNFSNCIIHTVLNTVSKLLEFTVSICSQSVAFKHIVLIFKMNLNFFFTNTKGLFT